MGYGGRDGKLDAGAFCSYRPTRKQARRYTASDVARIYCHAVAQGVARSAIADAIEKRCPAASQECTCSELMSELHNALKVAELAIAIIAILVPAVRVLRALMAAAKVKKLPKPVVDEAEKAIKTLENQPITSGRILEAEYERIIEKQAEVAAKMDAGVVIRP